MENKAWGRQCALIAAALPGLFTLEDLYEMDLRDFVFWAEEADRIERMREARIAGAVRVAFNADAKGYEQYVRSLFDDRDIHEQASPQVDRVKESWDYLKAVKRG